MAVAYYIDPVTKKKKIMSIQGYADPNVTYSKDALDKKVNTKSTRDVSVSVNTDYLGMVRTDGPLHTDRPQSVNYNLDLSQSAKDKINNAMTKTTSSEQYSTEFKESSAEYKFNNGATNQNATVSPIGITASGSSPSGGADTEYKANEIHNVQSSMSGSSDVTLKFPNKSGTYTLATTEDVDNVDSKVDTLNEALDTQKDAGYMQKNIADIEGWAKSLYNQNITKNGNAITFGELSSVLSSFPLEFAKEDKMVTVSAKSISSVGGSNFKIQVLNSENTVVGTLTSTNMLFSGNASKMRFDYSSKPTTITIDEFMVEYGNTKTNYVPYCPPNTEITTLKETLMDEKMLGWTVPAECTIRNNYDANTFTQNVFRVKLSDLDWTYDSSNKRFYADYAGIISTECYCEKFAYEDINNSWSDKNKVISGFFTQTLSRIYAKDTTYDNASAFKASVNGIYAYVKKTPITITIDGNETVENLKQSFAEQIRNNYLGKNLFNLDSWTNDRCELNVEPGKPYTLKIYFKKDAEYAYKYIYLISEDVSGSNETTEFAFVQNVYKGDVKTFTPVSGKTYFMLYHNKNDLSIVDKIQLESGTNATEYVEFVPSNKEIKSEVDELKTDLSSLIATLTSKGILP